MRAALISTAVATIAIASIGRAEEIPGGSESSFFIGIDLGTGLDLDEDARSPRDMTGERPEAYSVESFLFGIHGGFRFNEVIGVEGGWHEQKHSAQAEWGGAFYQIGHLALRLAWPLKTRQTPVLVLGPAIGAFTYGSVWPGGVEDNSTLTLGGFTGLVLEHELVLGVVAVLRASYLPIFRFGEDGVYELWVDDNEGWQIDDGEVLDSKDFTDGRVVHLLWISLGIQFEWTFR